MPRVDSVCVLGTTNNNNISPTLSVSFNDTSWILRSIVALQQCGATQFSTILWQPPANSTTTIPMTQGARPNTPLVLNGPVKALINPALGPCTIGLRVCQRGGTGEELLRSNGFVIRRSKETHQTTAKITFAITKLVGWGTFSANLRISVTDDANIVKAAVEEQLTALTKFFDADATNRNNALSGKLSAIGSHICSCFPTIDAVDDLLAKQLHRLILLMSAQRTTATEVGTTSIEQYAAEPSDNPNDVRNVETFELHICCQKVLGLIEKKRDPPATLALNPFLGSLVDDNEEEEDEEEEEEDRDVGVSSTTVTAVNGIVSNLKELVKSAQDIIKEGSGGIVANAVTKMANVFAPAGAILAVLGAIGSLVVKHVEMQELAATLCPEFERHAKLIHAILQRGTIDYHDEVIRAFFEAYEEACTKSLRLLVSFQRACIARKLKDFDQSRFTTLLNEMKSCMTNLANAKVLLKRDSDVEDVVVASANSIIAALDDIIAKVVSLLSSLCEKMDRVLHTLMQMCEGTHIKVVRPLPWPDSGGGAIYLAEQTQGFGPTATTRKVVLKEGMAEGVIELLHKMPHPNLCPVLGIWKGQVEAGGSERSFAVLEALDGTLEQFIQKANENDNNLNLYRLCITKGIVSALGYLHAQCPQVLHNNLQPLNVMLRCETSSSSYTAKLVGFDCAILRHETLHFVDTKLHPFFTTAVQPSFYTAPEVNVNNPKSFTASSDVYSLGAVLVQLWSKCHVDDSEASSLPQDVRSLANEPYCIPLPVAALIVLCMRTHPKSRPNALTVSEELQHSQFLAQTTRSKTSLVGKMLPRKYNRLKKLLEEIKTTTTNTASGSGITNSTAPEQILAPLAKKGSSLKMIGQLNPNPETTDYSMATAMRGHFSSVPSSRGSSSSVSPAAPSGRLFSSSCPTPVGVLGGGGGGDLSRSLSLRPSRPHHAKTAHTDPRLTSRSSSSNRDRPRRNSGYDEHS